MINLDNFVKNTGFSASPDLKDEISAIREKNRRFKTRESVNTYEKVFYPDGSAILCWINTQLDTFPTHWHPSIELLMPLENHYYVKIGDKEYILNDGDILIIPPGELHELAAKTAGYRLILLFDYSAISNLKGFSSMWHIISSPILITNENAPEIYEDAKQILLTIMREYVEDQPHWEMLIYTLFIQLFLMISRNDFSTNSMLLDINESKQQEYVDKFNMVFEYIDKKYMENITLESMASLVGFSKYHFARLFKQYTNESFYHYLNARRIRAAETLLTNPDTVITDVAHMSGFTSISTFNRVFRSFKNCSPTEFKTQLNSGNTRYKTPADK